MKVIFKIQSFQIISIFFIISFKYRFKIFEPYKSHISWFLLESRCF